MLYKASWLRYCQKKSIVYKINRSPLKKLVIMLSSLARSRELRAQQKASEIIQNGLQLVRKKLFKQATLQFNNAFKINADITGVTLDKHYKRFKHGGNHEATLAIGLILLKIRRDDYKLANVLGNCSRRQGEYKQANELYRHALRKKRNFHLAYYNLAASMGKVDRFDSEVKTAVERFTPAQRFILPDYQISPEFVVKIINKLTKIKQIAKEKRIRKLIEERLEREAKNELLQVHRLTHLLEEEEHTPPTPSYEDVSKYLRLMIKQGDGKQGEEDLLQQQKYIYNFTLYALDNEDGKTALEQLDQLQEKGAKFDFLEMMRALANVMIKQVNEGTKLLISLLGTSQSNRFYNVNLGLVYRRLGNHLLSFKYLAIGSVLLEKSQGLYKLSDLVIAADEHFDAARHQKALQLYKVVVSEDENANACEKIGRIYIQLEKLEDATKAFRALQKIEGKAKLAIDYLYQIHDYYFSEAEDLFRDRKYKAAVLRFEKAMAVLRLPETLKRAAAVYTVLRDKKRSVELLEECEEIKERLREEEQERLRQNYVLQGKKFRKLNRLQKAVEYFELAFRLKLDKDVFMYLAYLYKSMNKADDLQDLLNRWNKMVELEDRLKQYKDK